ncbi:MAG: glycogen-binding domain-containing protein [Kiritimatiellia bacterium]
MESSTRDKKRKVQFRLAAPAGSGVFVAGTFNGWDTLANPLKESAQGGAYAATVPLLPGRYEYKFVINGDWRVDPNASETVSNGLGSKNSVIII